MSSSMAVSLISATPQLSPCILLARILLAGILIVRQKTVHSTGVRSTQVWDAANVICSPDPPPAATRAVSQSAD